MKQWQLPNQQTDFGEHSQMFQRLMGEPTKYLKHYIDLSAKYPSEADVYCEFAEDVKKQIRELAAKDSLHPKYKTYTEMNMNSGSLSGQIAA